MDESVFDDLGQDDEIPKTKNGYDLFTNIPEDPNYDPNREWRIVDYLKANGIPYELGEPVKITMLVGNFLPVYFDKKFFDKVNAEWRS